MSGRPIKELEFLLAIIPAAQVNIAPFVQFLFPLAIFEDLTKVAVLIPKPLLKGLYKNYEQMWEVVDKGAADVSVPYHPPQAIDVAIYNWRVRIAWKGIDEPALMESMILDKYAKRMYELYASLAQPMEFELDFEGEDGEET